MAKLYFHELISFFWNREDFAIVSTSASKARIYKKSDDELSIDPYYMVVEADGDIVESIDFYTINMHHMKKDEASKFVKAFSFDVWHIESVEHLVDVCKNTFDQMVVEEILYLQQQMNKMNKLLIG